MFRWVRRVASARKLVMAAVLLVAMFVPMNAFVSEWQEDSQVTLMDFVFGGYGAEDVARILEALGSEGRSTCLRMLGLDCIMGLLYLAVLGLAIALLQKRVGSENGMANALLALPLAAMASDWVESLMTYLCLMRFPVLSEGIVAVESTCTTLKFVLLAASACAIVVLGVANALKGISKCRMLD